MPTKASQILQAALHLQNVLISPSPNATTATTTTSEIPGRQQKTPGVGAPRPMSMILPNKTQPPVISSRTFSPKREDSQKLHQPVKVNRSISNPSAQTYLQASPSMQNPSSPVPSNRTIPSSPLLQASSRSNSLITDYPRMRAAASMSNLPTEARSDPKATRAILEAWKNSKVGTGANRGTESNPVPLHNSSHHSGPRAVVEIPSQLPPKHQGGRHYMSSPNIHQDASDQSRVRASMCMSLSIMYLQSRYQTKQQR